MAGVSQWSDADLRRFLIVRQEFFLDPMGSNRERFIDAALLLQRALFDWYLKGPTSFTGMLSLVAEQAEAWSKLRKEERRTLLDRRFALSSAVADAAPAVESSVSENQWQRIFGSLGLGLGDPGTFDRFLVQLDEETNPSLRFNHRYLGELLPHDNMISYLSSVTATFLNENAIIGKVSPCVTHMEEAAVHWLLTLVGWDGLIRIDPEATEVPLQRLPTAPRPNEHAQRWKREEPTGTVVAGGTLANISALLIARNAVFDYLLGWEGAVQTIGPTAAWDAIRETWGYQRLVVVTSEGAHYSVRKSALQAGIPHANVLEISGSENPWVLDATALRATMEDLKPSRDLIVAVVLIAGKTESGDVDDISGVGNLLNEFACVDQDWGTAGEPVPWALALPPFRAVLERVANRVDQIVAVIERHLRKPEDAVKFFRMLIKDAAEERSGAQQLSARAGGLNEIQQARHNRLFMHVDAAHGAGYLTVPALRFGPFKGIELADTITIDGHKSLYCYYPCGGLLIRTTRWARTMSAGHTDYISEETNYSAYEESSRFFEELRDGAADADGKILPSEVRLDEHRMYDLVARQTLAGRSLAADRSELTHQPFNQYLEGSRGPQGIMQLYFNLATLGLRGYRSILEWTHLLSKRCEEAISLGLTDVRLITDPPFEGRRGSDKALAIASSNPGVEVDPIESSDQIMPVGGGRFLRLSNGTCNQVLMTYIPAREAKLIVSRTTSWTPQRVRQTLSYLWRVNEHLWHKHIYANPNFTYYLGHTTRTLKVPTSATSPSAGLAALLEDWNVWLRPAKDHAGNAFLLALAEIVADEEARKVETAGKFFCHKVIVMHPYTDESLLGDMLRRVAFWGERSVTDVSVSDAIAETISRIPRPKKKR